MIEDFENETCCRECNREGTPEWVRRHQKSHNGYPAYCLKHKHAGIRPLCVCGCRCETSWNIALKDFASFIKGHSAVGHAVSQATKEKIGKANSVKMKLLYASNPELKREKSYQLRRGITSESSVKRRETLKETWKDSELRARQSIHVKRLWTEQRKKMMAASVRGGQTFHERVVSGELDLTERNEKISDTIVKRYQDGSFDWQTGKYVTQKMGVCAYRSSYELAFLRYLDRDPNVISWKYEDNVVKYIFEERQRNYLPDFVITLADGTTHMIEVKPARATEWGRNAAKAAAAKAYCDARGWTFRFWPESDSDIPEADRIPPELL